MRIIPFCGFASVPPDLAVWLSMANKTLRLLFHIVGRGKRGGKAIARSTSGLG